MFTGAPLAAEEATTASTTVQAGSNGGGPPGSHRDQTALDAVYNKYSAPAELRQLEAAEREVPCVKDNSVASTKAIQNDGTKKLAPPAAPKQLPASKPPRR